MINKRILGMAVLGISAVVLQGCGETVPANGGAVDISGKASLNGAVLGGDVYHTGYVAGEGGFNYSIFISTRRDVEIDNPDPNSPIAMVQTIVHRVDPNDFNGLIQLQLNELKQAYTDAGEVMSSGRERRYKRRLENPSFHKITPQKAGVVAIKATRSSGHWETIWEKPEIRYLVVNSYTSAQIQAGQNRYENDLTRPCTSCHLEGNSTAPTHLLGRVIQIDDAAAIEWITTGSTKDRIANFASQGHQWQFQNDAEKLATVAYLRSKQTPSEKDYAKLLFEEELAETRAELEVAPKLSTIDPAKYIY